MPDSRMNVYFTVIDGGSPVLARIGDKTKALDKETQKLNQSYAAMQKANKDLQKKQQELEKQLDASKKECKEAKKAFEKLGDAASSDAYDAAKQKQLELQQSLKQTTAAIKDNEKAYKSNMETIRKGVIGGSESKGLSNIAWGLAASGVGSQLSSSIGSYLGSYLTSEIGTPDAAMASGIMSGLISGGAAGASLGPWGIAAGALLGGVSGYISGKSQIFQAEDDAFKSYYNGLYESVNEATSSAITSGSGIAAGRETDAVSFATLFGSKEQAADYLKSMVDLSNQTPFLYEDLKTMSKTLKTYGWATEDMIPDLTTIGDAGAALGMSTSDMNSVATALGRMKSSDKATLEYLNILNDRGINAVSMLAEARGKSVGDTYTDISKGNISGGEAVEIILAAMEKTFAGSMEEQSQTFSGLSSTLEGLQQEIENAAGEGYNNERKGGIQDEIAALGGPLGEALSKVAEVSGQNQAYLENLSEQYQREALSAVLLGEKTTLFDPEQQAALEGMAAAYADASERYAAGSQEAGLEMESLKEQAEALATAAYDSNEFVKQAQDVQQEQISAIRENTAALDGWRNAFDQQQELSKGQGIGILSGTNDSEELGAYAGRRQYARGIFFSSAYGLDRVPYDGFPAVLHEGERVLTASQARAKDAGNGGVQIIVTGNSFQGTGEEMADQLAEILARRLEQAAITAAPR